MSTKITVQLLYFAAIRERLGLAQESIELAQGSTLTQLWEALETRHEILAALRPHLRVAVNHDFATQNHTLEDGDEIALIPPVAGGAPHCWLTPNPLDAREVEALVTRPEAGAVVTFRGTVRNHTRARQVEYLEYEVYPAMATAKLEQVVQELQAQWPLCLGAIAHRYGRLLVGESAVVIAVSSPHRADAFAACQFAIDRIKEIVPIWKKEVGPDGSTWVGFGS